MKFHGPLVTLAVGALTGGTLLAMSAHAARPQDPPRAAAAAGAVKASPSAPARAAAAAPAPEESLVAEASPPEPAPPPAAADQQPATASSSTTEAAPAELPTDELAAYAGRLKGGRYALVMAVRGDRAVGYLCDGDQVEAWFRGTLSGAQLRLTDKAGERLAATLRPGRATGELDALGTHWSFTVSAVDPASVRTVTAKVAP
jgi:hypothetical protein